MDNTTIDQLIKIVNRVQDAQVLIDAIGDAHSITIQRENGMPLPLPPDLQEFCSKELLDVLRLRRADAWQALEKLTTDTSPFQ